MNPAELFCFRYGPGAETLLLTRTVAKGLRVVSLSEFYADSESVDLKSIHLVFVLLKGTNFVDIMK